MVIKYCYFDSIFTVTAVMLTWSISLQYWLWTDGCCLCPLYKSIQRKTAWNHQLNKDTAKAMAVETAENKKEVNKLRRLDSIWFWLRVIHCFEKNNLSKGRCQLTGIEL
jgi:hypothetical protein